MDAKMNLYELIGSEPTASTSEIKKAYRKKALTCHPDKNPNNPKAAELFHELSKALEILTDEKARTSYDQVIAARKRAKKRDELDAKRRKLNEGLEAREEAYKNTLDPTSNKQRLKDEIERLEKERRSRLMEEMVDSIQKKIWEQLHGVSKNLECTNVDIFRIEIMWVAHEEDRLNGGYNFDNLYKIFRKYGDLVGVCLASSTKGRGMIEFKDKNAAETALLTEIGLAHNPLTLRGL